MSKGEIPVFADTFLAGADLSGKIGLAVKLDNAGKVVLCGAGESSIGILQMEETADKAVRVMVLGNTWAVLGAAVTNAGTNLTPDAAGKLVTAGGGDAVVAYSLSGGADGETIAVSLCLKSSSGTTGLAKSYMTYQFPLTLTAADDRDLVTDFTPGFAGKIVGLAFVAAVAATTADKTASIAAHIGATPTTGGVLSLTTVACNAIGKVTAATAITALNAFADDDTISIVAADTAVPFIEGSGTLVLTVEI